MKLNKVLAALTLGLAIAVAASCSNRAQVSISSSGQSSATRTETITCFSGGVRILSDTSDGIVWSSTSGIFEFKSKTTGKDVRVLADCITEE